MSEEMSLLQSLINAAEKASNIARTCRSNPDLLNLLVQEKSGAEANSARFEHDFKTLADVLIQETIKHDVGQLFPAMRDAIKGEESASFTNTLGETVTIAVGASIAETSQCLATVLNGNTAAAHALAVEVHRTVEHECSKDEMPALPQDVDYGRLGIWIDPIDGTAEYIAGGNVPTKVPDIPAKGLLCVTVLIGVYERPTGEPIMGVISQPFHVAADNNEPISRIFWGISWNAVKASNCSAKEEQNNSTRLAILSSSERPAIVERLEELAYDHVASAGAGHKALRVISGDAQLYVLSKGSTFKWDTCAPQAILRSMGGDMYDLRASLDAGKPRPLNYAEPELDAVDGKCNVGGLVAVRDVEAMPALLAQLANIIL